jgi:hypothetical protein
LCDLKTPASRALEVNKPVPEAEHHLSGLIFKIAFGVVTDLAMHLGVRKGERKWTGLTGLTKTKDEILSFLLILSDYFRV